MARPGIEKGQVVWAKLGGYPWWPGIVDEIEDEGQNKDSGFGARRVTVKFIGENTHASVHHSKVVDFEDFLLEHSKTKKKHLLRCIEFAKKFANKDLSIADLSIVNQKLDRKHRPSSTSPAPDKPRKQAKVAEKQTSKAIEKKESQPELPVIEVSRRESRASSPVTQDSKKDTRMLNTVGMDKKEQRPIPALLSAKPITWNSVPAPASSSIKPPSSGQPTDVKLPDPPSADKLIKPVSLPYLRQQVSVHNQVSLAQSCLASFIKYAAPPAPEVMNALTPLFGLSVPAELLPRFLRVLKHFYTSLPDTHRSLVRVAQKLFFALKHRELTHILNGMVKSSEVDSPQMSTEVSIEQSTELPHPIPESLPLIKDDVSTCSVENSVPDGKVADLSEISDPITFPESEEFVADKEKRRHVCANVYRTLISRKFSDESARDYALKIEKSLRRKDPTMGEKYSSQYKRMIKDIQKLQPQIVNGGN